MNINPEKPSITHRDLPKVEAVASMFKSFDLDVPKKTAMRFTEVLKSVVQPRETLDNIVNGVFKTDFDGFQMEKGIPIFSFCAHHVLPWFGMVSVAYIAQGKVVGISKFTRIVNLCSTGVTIQEDVCREITNTFVTYISPDVICSIEAIHTCKVARGVENPFSRSITIDARGVFRDNMGPRLEFLHMLDRSER